MIGEHFEHLLGCELEVLIGTFEDAVREGTFALVEAQDFLLDGVVADEVIDSDGLLLTDSVGTVCGLLLDSGVPPWIQMNDIVGSRQVQSHTSSFQADEEHGALTFLEVSHELLALPYGDAPVEVEVGSAGPSYSTPLTFEVISEGDKTIAVTSPRAGMYYKKNGGDQVALTAGVDATIDVTKGDKVAFYGTATSYFVTDTDFTNLHG